MPDLPELPIMPEEPSDDGPPETPEALRQRLTEQLAEHRASMNEEQYLVLHDILIGLHRAAEARLEADDLTAEEEMAAYYGNARARIDELAGIGLAIEQRMRNAGMSPKRPMAIELQNAMSSPPLPSGPAYFIPIADAAFAKFLADHPEPI